MLCQHAALWAVRSCSQLPALPLHGAAPAVLLRLLGSWQLVTCRLQATSCPRDCCLPCPAGGADLGDRGDCKPLCSGRHGGVRQPQPLPCQLVSCLCHVSMVVCYQSRVSPDSLPHFAAPAGLSQLITPPDHDSTLTRRAACKPCCTSSVLQAGTYKGGMAQSQNWGAAGPKRAQFGRGIAVKRPKHMQACHPSMQARPKVCT